ncbi:MAG: hypothetical protein WBV82_26445 [Myxococcaceae bacterium]
MKSTPSRLLPAVLAATLCACGAEDTGFVRADSGTTKGLRAVHGSSATDVWAVGDEGTITHFDGTRWTVTPSAAGAANLSAVFGINPQNAWAVGANGTVVRWNGQQWSRMDLPSSKHLLDVWASGPNDVWILPDDDNLKAAIRWDGSEWRVHRYGSTYAVGTLWGSGPDDVWVGGLSKESWLFRTRQGEFQSVPVDPSAPSKGLDDIDGTGPNDVWAVSTGAVFHFDGTSLKQFAPAPDPEGNLAAIWSSSPRDVWVAGISGEVHHFDGSAWTVMAAYEFDEPDLTDLWGTGPDNLWLVGSGGAIFRWSSPVVAE